MNYLSQDAGQLGAPGTHFQIYQSSDSQLESSPPSPSLGHEGRGVTQEGVWPADGVATEKWWEPTCSREVNTLEARVTVLLEILEERVFKGLRD